MMPVPTTKQHAFFLLWQVPTCFDYFGFADDNKASTDANANASNKTTCILLLAGPPCFDGQESHQFVCSWLCPHPQWSNPIDSSTTHDSTMKQNDLILWNIGTHRNKARTQAPTMTDHPASHLTFPPWHHSLIVMFNSPMMAHIFTNAGPHHPQGPHHHLRAL